MRNHASTYKHAEVNGFAQTTHSDCYPQPAFGKISTIARSTKISERGQYRNWHSTTSRASATSDAPTGKDEANASPTSEPWLLRSCIDRWTQCAAYAPGN